MSAEAQRSIPIACTLEADAVPDRSARWRALLDEGRSRSALDGGGVRVELDADVDLHAVVDLVAAEQQCCAFFAFSLTVDDRGVGLEVRAPAEAQELVVSLFAPMLEGQRPS